MGVDPFDPASEIEAVARRFRARGNAERAAAERAYLKSALRFHGVGMPGVRAAAKELLKAHEGRASGLTFREASKYLPPAMQKTLKAAGPAARARA